MLLSFLTWGGLASCSLGGFLALVGLAKGKQARQLGAAVPVDSLADLKQLFALVPILVAVTGRVLAHKPLKCQMSECEAAIVEMREEKKSERRASSGVWIGDSQVLREAVTETEWGLTDGSRTELPVEAGRRAEGDYLQMSGDRLVPDNQHQLVRIADEMLGCRSLGLRQVERMLPAGTMLTAVGELTTAVEHPSAFQGAVRRGGKMLVLRQPAGGGGPFVLSRKPLPELIASLQSDSIACQQWAAAFTAVGASMLVAAATQHAMTWVRKRRLRRRVEKALREQAAARAAGAAGAAGSGGSGGAAAAGGGGGGDSAAAAEAAGEAGLQVGAGLGGGGGGDALGAGPARSLCVICLERPCQTVFPSCGHMCACSRCSGSLKRCPICRSRGGPIRVYTP